MRLNRGTRGMLTLAQEHPYDTATKNNVPPSSTLVMTVLVLRTSPSRKSCMLSLRSSRSLPEHRAYTPRLATSENSVMAKFAEFHFHALG